MGLGLGWGVGLGLGWGLGSGLHARQLLAPHTVPRRVPLPGGRAHRAVDPRAVGLVRVRARARVRGLGQRARVRLGLKVALHAGHPALEADAARALALLRENALQGGRAEWLPGGLRHHALEQPGRLHPVQQRGDVPGEGGGAEGEEGGAGGEWRG